MGMAASQARLLSITTRLSDNELRAQVINNSKIRLATESARVSERYVQALNDANMMFTNTDLEGNTQYQALTFNNLTQYSPTNTQFGLINGSGNILVSEREAYLFKNSKGDINKYLEAHGLVFKSSYFENLNAHAITNPQQGKVGTIGESGYTAAELKELYFGTKWDEDKKMYVDTEGNIAKLQDRKHQGYKTGLTSTEYVEYDKLITKYTAVKDTYQNATKAAARKYIRTLTVNGQTFEEFQNSLASIDQSNHTTKLDEFKAFWNAYQNGLLKKDSTLRTEVPQLIDDIENNKLDYQTEKQYAGSYHVYLPDDIDGSKGDEYWIIKKDDSDNWSATWKGGSEGSEQEGTMTPTGNGNFKYTETITEDDGTSYTYTETYTRNGDSYDVTWSCEQLEVESYQSGIEDLCNYLMATAVDNVDLFQLKLEGSEGGFADDLKAAANDLYQFMCGTNCPQDKYLDLDTTEFIFGIKDKNGNITGALADNLLTNDFKNIKDILVIEQLLDIYGEPQEAWAFTDPNKTGNADAEAKWYTNLFNKMMDGYTVLENGLAASSEWIQYALESGLVTVAQVNSDSQWATTMYSNVSSITEKTETTQVTIAEAEYNREMNRIQSKDKQYDLELKNIDTEHNSLQTEYDSVKSVIDKNVERNLKLYS